MNTEGHLANQDKWKTRAYMGVAAVAGCALLWVLAQVIGVLWQAVATVVVTAIIAFMLHGIVDRLVDRGLSRAASSAIAVVGLVIVLLASVAAFVPALVEQVSSFSSSLPEYVRGAQDVVEGIVAVDAPENTLIDNLTNQAIAWVQEQAGSLIQVAAGSIVEGVASVGSGLVVLFIALICAFWVLADLPTISRELLSLFNDEQQKNIRVVSDAFGTAVYGWARATLVCAIVTGFINGIALWILGVPYNALLGLVCGILYFIPYLGSLIAALLVALIALLVSPLVAVVALAVNLVAHTVVANMISPKLMKSSVNVHPAIILVVILVGGALGGAVGMMFSIPVVAAFQGVFVTFYEKNTGRQLATEEGALFQKPKTVFRPTLRKREKGVGRAKDVAVSASRAEAANSGSAVVGAGSGASQARHSARTGLSRVRERVVGHEGDEAAEGAADSAQD